jgi:hypothetical protein
VSTTERPRRHLAAFVLTSLLVAAASAQTVQEKLDVTRQAVETQRRVLVAG